MTALIVGAAALAVFALSFRFSFRDPSVRATIETALTVSALASAWLLRAQFKHTRRLSDLLVLSALLTLALADLEFVAAPAMLGFRSISLDPVASVARVLVAVVFAAAALVPSCRRVHRKRESLAVFLAAPVSVVAVGTGAVLLSGHSGGAQQLSVRHGIAPVVLIVVAAFLMLLGALLFMRTAVRELRVLLGMLAGASTLLGAAWLHGLAVPVLGSASVSCREALRAAAVGLIIVGTLHSRAHLQRVAAGEAARTERRRIVRDLHDGLSQDLAFIAAHGERMAHDVGAEHPIAIAARRALATSRGAIADLSATDAPTPAAALEAVGRELASRYDVHVSLDADDTELTCREREELVRIAREAIMNAIDHGHAGQISVSLRAYGDRLMLRVSDDGCGIGKAVAEHPHRGFGLRAMRERTDAVGGRLVAQPGTRGGTDVEVVL